MSLPNHTRKHHRGRKAPPNLPELIAKSHAEHGERLKKLVTPQVLSFDWVALGKVPPVRDQSQCGSCWDFSGCGTGTMAFIVAGLEPADGTFDLSEQYVLDCGQNGGCNGDDNTTVLQMCQASGIATDDYGPYQAQAGQCKPYSGTLYKIDSWGFADSSGGQGITSTADIQEALVTYGPLGCAVAAGSDWDNYTGGESPGSGSTDINHDVMIVGWRPSTLKSGKVAWKVRNSWGASWGESGYMWLTEGGDCIGTETVFAVAGAAPPPPPSPGPGPDPMPTLGNIVLSQDMPAGSYMLMANAMKAVQSGLAIPAWLAGLMADLCFIGPDLPPPWNGLAAVLCGLIPPTGCCCEEKRKKAK